MHLAMKLNIGIGVFSRARKLFRNAFRQRVDISKVQFVLPGWRQPTWFAVSMITTLTGLGWYVCWKGDMRVTYALLSVAVLYALYLVLEWVSLLGQYTTSMATSPVELLVTHHRQLRQQLANTLSKAMESGSFMDERAIASDVDSMLATLKSAPPWTRIALFLFGRIGINFLLMIVTLSTIQMAALFIEAPDASRRYAVAAGGYPGVLTDYILSESVVVLGAQSNSPPAHSSIPCKLFVAAQNFYLTWFLTLVVGGALVTAAVLESTLRDQAALAGHFRNFIKQRVPDSQEWVVGP